MPSTRLVDAALEPLHALQCDAALVGEEPARVDRGGPRPLRHPDAPAGEVPGLGDRAVAADEDRRMAEHARREDRMAISESSPPARSDVYLASDISETSHSRKRLKRKKISSTLKLRERSATPSTATVPSTRSRTWS